jgi:uncharacterized membrane protein YvlD (DUF360 family)
MVRLILSALVYLAANAIGLLVAAAVLDDMSLDAGAFVIAVVIFTVVEVVIQPLITQVAVKSAHVLVGSSALVATFVGLVITDLLSDGLSITGAWTWVLATVIVWAAALFAGFILPALVLKRAVSDTER